MGLLSIAAWSERHSGVREYNKIFQSDAGKSEMPLLAVLFFDKCHFLQYRKVRKNFSYMI